MLERTQREQERRTEAAAQGTQRSSRKGRSCLSPGGFCRSLRGPGPRVLRTGSP